MQLAMKLLMGLGVRLLTEKFLEDLVLWALELLAGSTKTKVDDELVAIVKKHLKKD